MTVVQGFSRQKEAKLRSLEWLRAVFVHKNSYFYTKCVSLQKKNRARQPRLQIMILSVIYFLEMESIDTEEEEPRRSDRKSRSSGKESKNKESSRTKSKNKESSRSKSKSKEESSDEGTSHI